MDGLTIYDCDNPILEIEWTDKLEFKSKIVGEWTIFLPSDLKPERITANSFFDWVESRLPEKTRGDIDYILRIKYKLKAYLPMQMIRKSYGVMLQDFLWVKFKGEDICLADVRIR